MEAKSVIKEWKNKSFAAWANRTVTEKGAAVLGVDLKNLFTDAIMRTREVAPK